MIPIQKIPVNPGPAAVPIIQLSVMTVMPVPRIFTPSRPAGAILKPLCAMITIPAPGIPVIRFQAVFMWKRRVRTGTCVRWISVIPRPGSVLIPGLTATTGTCALLTSAILIQGVNIFPKTATTMTSASPMAATRLQVNAFIPVPDVRPAVSHQASINVRICRPLPVQNPEAPPWGQRQPVQRSSAITARAARKKRPGRPQHTSKRG